MKVKCGLGNASKQNNQCNKEQYTQRQSQWVITTSSTTWATLGNFGGAIGKTFLNSSIASANDRICKVSAYYITLFTQPTTTTKKKCSDFKEIQRIQKKNLIFKMGPGKRDWRSGSDCATEHQHLHSREFIMVTWRVWKGPRYTRRQRNHYKISIWFFYPFLKN